jgi:hypothetical protein
LQERYLDVACAGVAFALGQRDAAGRVVYGDGVMEIIKSYSEKIDVFYPTFNWVFKAFDAANVVVISIIKFFIIVLFCYFKLF